MENVPMFNWIYTMTTSSGRTMSPRLGAQEKYATPLIVPSFLPTASVSSTPTNSPLA